MTIRARLIILVMLSLLSVALLGYLFVAQSNKDITFARQELLGTSYLQTLAPDLVAIATGFPLPDGSKLVSAGNELNPILDTGKEAGAYLALRSAQTDTNYGKEIRGAATALVAKIGDASNLILDPDLDSFYVMDMAVGKLPAALSSGSQLVADLKAAASAPSDAQRIALVADLGAFDASTQAVANSLDSAIAGNPGGSVKAELSGFADQYAKDAGAFSAKMGEASVLVGAANAAKPLTEVQATLSVYASSTGHLLSASLIELSGLLHGRVAAMTYRLTLMLSLSGALVLMVFAVSWLFARSIIKNIDRLEAHIRRLADDQEGVHANGTGGKDEISAIARAVQYLREKTVERLQAAEQLRAAEQERTAAAERAAAEERAEGLRQVAKQAEAQGKMVAILSGNLQRLAQGDLDCRIEVRFSDEFEAVRQAFNSTVEGLRDIVGKLNHTSTSIRQATGEILAGANDLSERTTRQAASIEQTSAAMEQLSLIVASNADMAEQAASQAERVSIIAEEGGVFMAKATSAMEEITDSSQKISNIIGLIDDIAFQTNLLALNASVEAARAGEAGKGFAVVAIEVRRLAQSAAEASKGIKELIDHSAGKVDAGSGLVLQASEKLSAILGSLAESRELMAGIAAAGKDQQSAISEVTVGVRQMDEMTQHNAALVEETNAAIEQTEGQAQDLEALVTRFNLGAETPELPVRRSRAA